MRKIKTASFSLTNAYEVKLLAYAELKEHGDYSRYVKRLIGRDMEGQGRPPVTAFVNTPTIEVVNDFSSFI